MLASAAQTVVSLPQSPFPPLAVGFMGLGTGYLIYGQYMATSFTAGAYSISATALPYSGGSATFQ